MAPFTAPHNVRRVLAAAGLGLSLLVPATPASARGPALSGATLLERLTNPLRAALPLPTGARVVQFSSHDRTGGNLDGGVYDGAGASAGRPPPAYVRREAGGFVLLEVQRPGCVVRTQMTGVPRADPSTLGPTDDFGHLQLFFDGEAKPRFDELAKDFFAGADPRFPAPLVGDPERSSGSNYAYVPFCFSRSLKLRITGSPEDFLGYYDIDVLEAPSGTRVETFDPVRLDGRAAAARLARSGASPARAPDVDARRDVAAGVTRLADLPGSGSIRYVRIGVEPFDVATLQALRLQVRTKGAGEPQIDVPLGDLFGDGQSVRPISALAFGMSPETRTGYLALPVPFARGASIAVAAKRTAGVHLEAWRGPPLPHAGTLYGEQRVQKTQRGRDYVALEAIGSGRLASVVLDILGNQGTGVNPLQSFLEGDERVYLDGSRSPSIYGEGTEDFFNGGFYYARGAFGLPTHGAGPLLVQGGFRGAQSQYRVFAIDPFVWSRAIRLGIEHGGGDEDPDRTVAVTTFSYRADRKLRRTDSVAPANADSARAHLLRGSFQPARLAAYFEGELDGNLPAATFPGTLAAPAPPPSASPEGVTADGIAFTTPVSFRLRLQRRNAGAVIRRLLDQGSASALDVLVNGHPAGRWTTGAPPNPEKRWLQDDFPLPARLTARHRSVRVTLAPVDGATSTAYRLVAFSRRRDSARIMNPKPADAVRPNSVSPARRPTVGRPSQSSRLRP